MRQPTKVYKAGESLGIVTNDGLSSLLGKPHTFHAEPRQIEEGFWHEKTGYLFLKWDKLGWYYYRGVTAIEWTALTTALEPKREFYKSGIFRKPYKRISKQRTG